MSRRESSLASRPSRAMAAFTITFLLGLALPKAVLAGATADLTLVVGQAHRGDGRTLGPTRLKLSDGRIASVEPAGDAAEQGAIDLRGLVATPGFIDLRSGAGLDARNEEGSEITPSLLALDLVDAASLDFARALSGGVTTVVISPGGRAVIGGLASALKTDDRPLAQRVLLRQAGLVITLGNEPSFGNRLSRFQTPSGLYYRRPGTRMGVVAAIRRAFDEPASGPQADAPAFAAADRAALARARSGELPVLWRAQVEQDILTVARLAGELGLPRNVLVNPVEGHRVPEQVARQAGAILGPFYQQPRRVLESIEGEDFRAATPAILAAAGARVAIATGPDDPPECLRDRALLATRDGLSPELALSAITGQAAALLGLPRVGDLAAGNDADVVLLDGPPLAPATRVVAVIIEGRLAWAHPDAPAALASLRAPASIPEHVP